MDQSFDNEDRDDNQLNTEMANSPLCTCDEPMTRMSRSRSASRSISRSAVRSPSRSMSRSAVRSTSRSLSRTSSRSATSTHKTEMKIARSSRSGSNQGGCVPCKSPVGVKRKRNKSVTGVMRVTRSKKQRSRSPGCATTLVPLRAKSPKGTARRPKSGKSPARPKSTGSAKKSTRPKSRSRTQSPSRPSNCAFQLPPTIAAIEAVIAAEMNRCNMSPKGSKMNKKGGKVVMKKTGRKRKQGSAKKAGKNAGNKGKNVKKPAMKRRQKTKAGC